MFGKKRRAKKLAAQKQQANDTVRQWIEEASADAHKPYSKNLTQLFNAASGIIEGLEVLRDMPGSKFNFVAQPSGDNLILWTNIVVGAHQQFMLVFPDRGLISMAANGEQLQITHMDQPITRNDVKQAVSFLARHAKRNRLIP